jgi:hypothetical protein
MKKLICVIIPLLLCLSLSACANEKQSVSKDNIQSSSETSELDSEQNNSKESELYDKVYSELSWNELDTLTYTQYPDFAITLSSPVEISKDDLEKEMELEFKVINMTDIKQEIKKISIKTYFINNSIDENPNPVSCDCPALFEKNTSITDFNNIIFEPYEIKPIKYKISSYETFGNYIQAFYLPIYYRLTISYDRSLPQGKKYDCFTYIDEDYIFLKSPKTVQYISVS